MPETVTKNQDQFGVFGIALALVTWFSGAAMCLIVGACAGAVIALHPGRLGRLARGDDDDVLVADAPAVARAPDAATCACATPSPRWPTTAPTSTPTPTTGATPTGPPPSA